MVTIKNKNNIIVCLLIFFCSCNILWDKGKFVDGHFVPRRPKFKFKDKANNVISPNLDTINAYLATYYSSNGIEREIIEFDFLKFYPHGRVLETRIWKSDSLVLRKTYKEALDARGIYTDRGYYYSKDGKHIQLEFFTLKYYWPKAGGYEIDNYYLNATGDTLTQWEPKDKYKRIYVKVKLPRVLEDYPVDW